jgi:uncharacterized repeat protein (TIGR03943 family)
MKTTLQRDLDQRGRDRAGQRRWASARVTAAAVFAVWSTLFWFLLLTNRVYLYLGVRTAWVVPVGGVLFAVGALGLLATARTTTKRRPFIRREALIAAVLVLPPLLVMTSPRSALGTFSVSKKAQYAGGGTWTYWGTFNQDSPITLQFVTAAKYWPQVAPLLAKRAGSDVDFVGFVARDPAAPADEFTLTRYVVSCCVADAAVAALRIVNVPPGSVSDGEWVEVQGQIYPIGSEIIVTATSIAQVATPSDPYLTP